MEAYPERYPANDKTYLGAAEPDHFREDPTPIRIAEDLIKIQVIHRKTGDSQEKVLTPKISMHGGVTIGRSPKCEIMLNSPEVSRVHGKILYQEGRYHFIDLGSTGGSQVNNHKVQENQLIPLNPNDLIQIGKFVLLVEEVRQARSEVGSAQLNETVLGPSLEQVMLLVLKVEELKEYGIPKQDVSEFVFQGRRLVAMFALSKRLRQRAIDFGQSQLEAGHFCLLIEHPTYLTVWTEK